MNAAHAAAANADSSYEWRLPPGFPRPAVPLDNPMSASKVALGRRLFFETRLSVTGGYSCSSCHRPELAFTDGRAQAQGATGQIVRRSAMSLTNVAYNPAFTWGSSKVRSLEAQMRQPLFNERPVEMGLKHDGSAVAALAADADYPRLFAAAFPGDPAPLTMDHIIKAIASFERTLISGRSPFDRYIYDDDRAALPESARRGMALFYSARIGCVQCHSGINFSGPIVYQGHAARALFANNGLYDADGHGAATRDRGLMEVTHRAQDRGKFRVPSLRNVALTAPYMHDGSLSSLDAVLDHYSAGGHGRALKDARIRPFALSAPQRTDLLAFLTSLTDRDFVENPAFSAPTQAMRR
ncbi:MAG TPA: MbnH family di-heme enzyme [Steroidobacteraceae bacterium]|jgi:cytochrome c peroxidase|nr:MbnH family di-heme enzyme [Steroidobacteraceae bacterium]